MPVLLSSAAPVFPCRAQSGRAGQLRARHVSGNSSSFPLAGMRLLRQRRRLGCRQGRCAARGPGRWAAPGNNLSHAGLLPHGRSEEFLWEKSDLQTSQRALVFSNVWEWGCMDTSEIKPAYVQRNDSLSSAASFYIAAEEQHLKPDIYPFRHTGLPQTDS